jgi:putative redox protein
MEVVIEYLGAVQFEIKARAHTIVSDQPRENGGYGEGMTPPELLLASLGSCAAFYAAQYLRKHKLATEGTRVRVIAQKEKNRARADHFHIEIEVPGQLDNMHRAGVEEAVHHCLLHNTLLHPPQIEFEIKSVALAPPVSWGPALKALGVHRTVAWRRSGSGSCPSHDRTCPPAI